MLIQHMEYCITWNPSDINFFKLQMFSERCHCFQVKVVFIILVIPVQSVFSFPAWLCHPEFHWPNIEDNCVESLSPPVFCSCSSAYLMPVTSGFDTSFLNDSITDQSFHNSSAYIGIVFFSNSVLCFRVQLRMTFWLHCLVTKKEYQKVL